MTLYRSHGRGSWIVERTFRRVGLVRRATGLADRTEAVELERLLVRLSQLRRDEILQAFRDGLVSGDELFRAYQQDGIDGLPTVEHIKPLREAVATWLAESRLAERTGRDYKATFDRLLASADERARVADLPDLLKRYRDEAKGGRSFNLARAITRSFVSTVSGRYGRLWSELGNIRPRPTHRRSGSPQTPDDARAVSRALGRYGGMWWSLCTSGMSGGPDGPYFLEQFEVVRQKAKHGEVVGLAIHGTKRRGRERVVPLLFTPVHPLVLYPAFARALRHVGLTANDGRRTYEAWLEASGVPKARRRRYMGHGVQDVTDLYGDEYPIWAFLGSDTQRLREHIGDDWTPSLAVTA